MLCRCGCERAWGFCHIGNALDVREWFASRAERPMFLRGHHVRATGKPGSFMRGVLTVTAAEWYAAMNMS